MPGTGESFQASCSYNMWKAITGVASIALGGAVGLVAGQLDQLAFHGSLEHPAIEYATRPLRDPVARLNRELNEGRIQLPFEPRSGFLRGVLRALDVPIESQIVAFSKTSLQSPRITPENPRTLFFNDSVAVAWVGGGFIELAATDPQQGINFYTLQFDRVTRPQFVHQTLCLSCHESFTSLDVPGLLVKSVFPSRDGTAMYQFGSHIPDHRSPFAERWGGWYVTGDSSAIRHMGNTILTDESLRRAPGVDQTPDLQTISMKLDQATYLSPYSDVAALMVFNHQTRMTNLLIRVGWEFRVARHGQSGTFATTAPLQEMVNELVDYLLFVDEAPLPGRVRGTSGFAEHFSASGPRDRNGRSLRELDLGRRLLRYPCSYMIYAEAFDGLPAEAKEAIYARMWQVLSGQDRSQRYARLSRSDRQAVVEILRDTKKELPDYFQREAR
jgi:hypothetical protein